MKKVFKIAFVGFAFLLSGCFEESSTPSSITPTIASNWDQPTVHDSDSYYVADFSNNFSLRDLTHSNGYDALPTKGNLKLLVIPIEFSDYPFGKNTISDLNKGLNGASSLDTGYWESLSSFYYKSSGGKINLEFTIADIYKTNKCAGEFYNEALESAENSNYSFDELSTMNMCTEVVNNYISNGNSTKSFDSDSDGYIDGVVMVYSCPNSAHTSLYYKGRKIEDDGELFWAFSYYDFNELVPNYLSPRPMTYFWMSYDFLYEKVVSPMVDSHTLIHEAGHLFGLDDYYGNGRAGGLSMMDLNILDLDGYSKTVLGWTKPYIVQDTCTINLEPLETSNEVIIIPTSNDDGSRYYNGTAFDEYILLELYTPTNLNELDTLTAYRTNVYGYSIPGIRMFHVDSRIVKEPYDSTSITYVPTYTNDENWYYVAASNTYKQAHINENFSLLEMINKSGTRYSRGIRSKNSGLFVQGDTFKFSDYSNFFIDERFNNGKTFSFEITFNTVNSTGATISFRKV